MTSDSDHGQRGRRRDLVESYEVAAAGSETVVLARSLLIDEYPEIDWWVDGGIEAAGIAALDLTIFWIGGPTGDEIARVLTAAIDLQGGKVWGFRMYSTLAFAALLIRAWDLLPADNRSSERLVDEALRLGASMSFPEHRLPHVELDEAEQFLRLAGLPEEEHPDALTTLADKLLLLGGPDLARGAIRSSGT